LKLTILGCQSPFPGPGGATAGYLLETEKGKILLDCGSGVISQLQKFTSVNDLDAVVLSHLHEDHISDVGILHYALSLYQRMGKRKSPLPIYIPEGTPSSLAQRIHYKQAVEVEMISAASSIELIGLHITFLQTEHGLPCLAMKFVEEHNKFVYGADAGKNTKFHPFIEGVDLFLCEGTYRKVPSPNRPVGHLSNVEAAQIASQGNCKHLVLTHLYPEFDLQEYLEEAQPFFEGQLSIARIGDQYII
jgi:ribonuclease BN (tRNA processing enzyme)